MIKISKLYIPLFSVFCLGAFFIIEPGIYLIYMLGSVLFHEAGHLAMMKIFKVRIASVTLLPIGIDIRKAACIISYPKQIIISMTGPFVNLILLLIFYGVSEGGTFFGLFNFLYAVFNLLPIKGLDGGEIFESFLHCFFEEKTVEKAVKTCSFIFCIFLWIIGVYILFVLNGNISVFALSVFLYASLFLKKQN